MRISRSGGWLSFRDRSDRGGLFQTHQCAYGSSKVCVRFVEKEGGLNICIKQDERLDNGEHMCKPWRTHRVSVADHEKVGLYMNGTVVGTEGFCAKVPRISQE